MAETVTSCSEWRPSFSSAVVTVFDAPGSTISSDVPSAADSVVAGATEPKPSSRETRNSTVPCAGTGADRAGGLGDAPDHRSISGRPTRSASPAARSVVLIVGVVAVLVVQRDRDVAVGQRLVADHRARLVADHVRLLAQRVLVDGDDVAVAEDGQRLGGGALRRSVPMISGAAIIAHRLKCVRYSVAVMPPLPTSSMSGSFQSPGPGVRGPAARSAR